VRHVNALNYNSLFIGGLHTQFCIAGLQNVHVAHLKNPKWTPLGKPTLLPQTPYLMGTGRGGNPLSKNLGPWLSPPGFEFPPIWASPRPRNVDFVPTPLQLVAATCHVRLEAIRSSSSSSSSSYRQSVVTLALSFPASDILQLLCSERQMCRDHRRRSSENFGGKTCLPEKYEQESCIRPIAKKTAQCAPYMGVLKIFGTP